MEADLLLMTFKAVEDIFENWGSFFLLALSPSHSCFQIIFQSSFPRLFNHSSSYVVPSRGTSLPLHLGSRVKLNIARLHEQLLVPLLHLVLHGWHIDGSKCISVQAVQLRLSPLLHCLEWVRLQSVKVRFSSTRNQHGGKASRRCFTVWNGFASKASKLGSPAPGTNMEEKPPACPTPNTSSYGQNRRLDT